MHDLDDALLASGRRKMRCASCRTVFEAAADESEREVTIAMPLPPREAAKGKASAGMDSADLGTPDLGTNLGQDKADDGADDDEPAAEPEVAEDDADAMAAAMAGGMEDGAEAATDFDQLGLNSGAGEDISADDLEALFADAAPAPDAAGGEAGEVDPMAQAMGEAAAAENADLLPAVGAGDAEGTEGAVAPLPNTERRANRRDAGGQKKADKGSRARSGGRGMVAAMVMAAGFASVGSLVMLREDVVRFVPGLASVFGSIGLPTQMHGLDITELVSQMKTEDARETLEVTGRVVNNTKRAQKLPVLRLAIRGAMGNELYVWTANLDVPELAPGQGIGFSRRLASPPAESHSVMVRFVAKDDIVAAIR